MNLQHHTHSIHKCVCPNSGNNCPFHPNHFYPSPLSPPIPIFAPSPPIKYPWANQNIYRNNSIVEVESFTHVGYNVYSQSQNIQYHPTSQGAKISFKLN